MFGAWANLQLSLSGFAFKSRVALFSQNLRICDSAVPAATDLVGLSVQSADALGFVNSMLFRLEFLCRLNPEIARVRLGPFPLPSGVDWGLAQGWQCWTESPIVTKNGLLQADAARERWVFGDNHFYPYEERPGCFHSWFFSYCGRLSDPQLHAFLCADSGGRFATCFVYDLPSGQVWLDIDTEGCLRSETQDAVQFVLPTELSATRSLHDDIQAWYKKLLCPRDFGQTAVAASRNVPAVPIRGYASWYHHYSAISHDLLARNLESMPASMTIFQIDDGYQKSIGDWTSTKESFGTLDALEDLIQHMRGKGVIPGLWLAPFVAVRQSELLAKMPHFLLCDKAGEPVRVGNIAHWGGDFFALDTELPEFQQWLERVIDFWTTRGIGFFKCDFLYAPGVSSCGKLTRLERAARAHEHLHRIIQSRGALLLSCGGILDQALGRCEFSRIGADIGQTWAEPDAQLAKSLRWSREKVSTVACLTNTLTRAVLAGSGFYNDADVTILRSFDTQLTFEERQLIAQINALASDVQFISCDTFAWSPEARELYDVMLGLEGQKWTQVEKVAPLEELGGIASQYYVRARDSNGVCFEKKVDFIQKEMKDHKINRG